jgi:hypothetical protein
MTASVCSKVTLWEAPCWTEYETQGEAVGHAMGVPQSSGWGGLQTAAVCGMPSLQLEVRQ